MATKSKHAIAVNILSAIVIMLVVSTLIVAGRELFYKSKQPCSLAAPAFRPPGPLAISQPGDTLPRVARISPTTNPANHLPAAPAVVAPLPVQETVDIDMEPILTTEQFEHGALKMSEVSSLRLESFIRDLEERRDVDRSLHDGRDGPDSPYLTRWINTVTVELVVRGYAPGPDGKLRRPKPTKANTDPIPPAGRRP